MVAARSRQEAAGGHSKSQWVPMCGKLTGRTGDVTRIFLPLGLFMAFRQM